MVAQLSQLGERISTKLEGAERTVKLLGKCIVGERADYYRMRLKSKLLDITDARFPVGSVEPATLETDAPEVLLEKMLPAAYREEFLAFLETSLPEEGTYGVRAVVGKGPTRHPHDFIVDHNPQGFRVQFLDPEEQVGRRDPTSPRIANLFVLDLPHDSSVQPDLAIGRFDTSRLAPEVRQDLMKMRTLREIAPSFLETGEVDGVPSSATYFLLHFANGKGKWVDAHAWSDETLKEAASSPENALPAHSGVRQTFLVIAVLDYVKSMIRQGHMRPYPEGSTIHSVQK